MNKTVYLYGASGHCKVIIDIVNKNNIKVNAIFDDNSSKNNILNIPVKKPENLEKIKEPFIISIGDNKVRQDIVEQHKKLKYCSAIHPNAIIDATSTIDNGSVVMAGVIINSSTKVGKHCIINTSSSIDHDCIIKDFVHISPNATLCGNVTIDIGSHIGSGSVIIQGVKIGKNVTIGAGSVIIKDVADNTTVVGNPGKVIKNN